jgi:hypothetical protein
LKLKSATIKKWAYVNCRAFNVASCAIFYFCLIQHIK